MASNFNRYTSRAIGSSPTSVGSYTVPANTVTTVIGLSVANIITTDVTVTVTHFDGVNTTNIAKDVPLPTGSSAVIVGGNQKIVMTTGDSVRVSSNTASSVDVLMSVLEVS